MGEKILDPDRLFNQAEKGTMGTSGWKLKSDVYTELRNIFKIKEALTIWWKVARAASLIP